LCATALVGGRARGDSFGMSIPDFSVAYADQNTWDYESLVKAVKSQRLLARPGCKAFLWRLRRLRTQGLTICSATAEGPPRAHRGSTGLLPARPQGFARPPGPRHRSRLRRRAATCGRGHHACRGFAPRNLLRPCGEIGARS
jgi:hypothetical protein